MQWEMRNKKRIDRFLELVDNKNLLTNIWKLPITEEKIEFFVELILEMQDGIRVVWNRNPDLRYSQVLVNTNILPNYPGSWYYVEEREILEQQGIDPSEFLLWGVNYDKDMNKLPETDYRFICDLNTDHIQTLLDGRWTGNPLYIKAFTEELKKRKDSSS